MRDNGLVLDGRTGGDPAASGKVVVSSSATAGAWQTMGESNQITAPKVSKAGDTMSGNLTFSDTFEGIILAGGSHLRDDVAGNQLQLSANSNRLIVYNEANSAQLIDLNNGSLVLPSNASIGGTLGVAGVATLSSNATVGGILGVTSNATVGGTLGVTGLLSGAAAAFSGALSALSAAITNAITAASLTATGLVKGSTLESTVSDGTTPPIVVNAAQAGVTATNLKAALAAAIVDGAVSTTAKLADGVVTGAKIADGTITDTDVAAANKDGASGTASLRTLGTGAVQAAAGNHAHTGMAKAASGSYTGNGAGTRAISGLGFAPKVVMIQRVSVGSSAMWQLMGHDMVIWTTTFTGFSVGNSLDGDGFTVTSGSDANTNTHGYIWKAFG